jgi:excisionase family DNA binding protein
MSENQNRPEGPQQELAPEATGSRDLFLLEDRLWLSITQAAKILNVARQTLYRWMEREENPFPRPRSFGTRVRRLSVGMMRRWVEGSREVEVWELRFADGEGQENKG